METNTTHGMPLLTALAQLAPHDHLCSIYESPEEHFAVAIPFIRIGLDRGEKCIDIADDGTEPAVRDAMYADGIDVERAIATDSLVLTMHHTGELARDVLQAGARGYQRSRALRDPQWHRAAVTAREREIVQLLAEGKSNKDAASTLGISVKTIEAHRANIMRKLRLRSISDLVRYAIRNKIVQP